MKVTINNPDGISREFVDVTQIAHTPTGKKHDSNKPKWNLLPWVAQTEVVKALTFGEKIYGADNWRHVPDGNSRYLAAALRHIVAWATGEKHDPESGLHHLAHAVCCLLFLIELDTTQERQHEK